MKNTLFALLATTFLFSWPSVGVAKENSDDILKGLMLILSWGLVVLPSIFARWLFVRKPLGKKAANWVSLGISIFFLLVLTIIDAKTVGIYAVLLGCGKTIANQEM